MVLKHSHFHLWLLNITMIVKKLISQSFSKLAVHRMTFFNDLLCPSSKSRLQTRNWFYTHRDRAVKWQIVKTFLFLELFQLSSYYLKARNFADRLLKQIQRQVQQLSFWTRKMFRGSFLVIFYLGLWSETVTAVCPPPDPPIVYGIKILEEFSKLTSRINF